MPKERATKCVIHFNRQRVSKGFPWTVHNRGTCHAVSHLHIAVPMESEEKPYLPNNPRYFFTCQGFVHTFKDGSVIITGSSEKPVLLHAQLKTDRENKEIKRLEQIEKKKKKKKPLTKSSRQLH